MKTINTNDKSLKKSRNVLLWVGMCLLVMGSVAGIIVGSWDLVPIGLLMAGLACVVAWLVLDVSSGEGFWGKRSTQVGTNAFAATLSVLLILGLINFMAIRYPVRVDLTENQQLTLATQSQQLVRNLKQPLKVWIFDLSAHPADQELLEKYRREGDNFSFEYVDPQLERSQAERFKSLTMGDVYLEYGERQQYLGNVRQNRISEVKLTNGIAQIVGDRKFTVYFLEGHGERSMTFGLGGLSQAVKTLETKSAIGDLLKLGEKSEVPEDASVVVVAGPKRSLFDREVKALKNYLDRGGSLMLMIDPATDPGLNSLLEEWGVTLEKRLAIDLTSSRPALPLISNYGDHPITKNFEGGYSYYPGARPLITTPVPGIQETPLLFTNENSWAESNPEKPPLKFDPESDRKGPLLLGVALSRPIKKDTASPTPTPTASPTPTPTASPEATASPTPSASPEATASPTPTPTPTVSPTAAPEVKSSEARMVIIGNSEFATDGLFEQQLNGDVFINSVSWLSKQDEETLAVRPKQPTNRRIQMTDNQIQLVWWLAVIIIPLIGFGSAGVLWWSRR